MSKLKYWPKRFKSREDYLNWQRAYREERKYGISVFSPDPTNTRCTNDGGYASRNFKIKYGHELWLNAGALE